MHPVLWGVGTGVIKVNLLRYYFTTNFYRLFFCKIPTLWICDSRVMSPNDSAWRNIYSRLPIGITIDDHLKISMGLTTITRKIGKVDIVTLLIISEITIISLRLTALLGMEQFKNIFLTLCVYLVKKLQTPSDSFQRFASTQRDSLLISLWMHYVLR